MALNLADVETQYLKDPNLNKQDVKDLQLWVESQPHLPKVNELQAILFLHSCYYKVEAAQECIEKFFTRKLKSPEMFKNLDVDNKSVQGIMKTIMMNTIRTPDDDVVFIMKFLVPDSSEFSYASSLKCFHMVTMLQFHQQGPSNGFVVIADVDNVTLGHVAKTGISGAKAVVTYMQEALPVRMKAMHFFNVMPFMNAIFSLLKTFMKKELVDLLHLHTGVPDLGQIVPLECLPEEYGGTGGNIASLHHDAKKKLAENRAFFEWEENNVTDESKRVKSGRRGYFW